MSNDNQAAEENNNPEGQKAPEQKDQTASEVNAETEAEKIAAAKNKIPFFNEGSSVLDEDGEINLLINALFEACAAKNIPFIGAINHTVEDEGDSFSVGIRAIQVIGKGGFTPANLLAMRACMESKELSELVLNIANDPMKMQMVQMMASLG